MRDGERQEVQLRQRLDGRSEAEATQGVSSSHPLLVCSASDFSSSQIGAIISYRFQEITKDKVPRFPTFVGERIDVNGPKDADVESKVAKKKGDGGDDE